MTNYICFHCKRSINYEDRVHIQWQFWEQVQHKVTASDLFAMCLNCASENAVVFDPNMDLAS